MTDVFSILTGLAAIGVLGATAYVSFKTGKFWGKSRDTTMALTKTMKAGMPQEGMTKGEARLRDKTTQAVTKLVADGYHPNDAARVLRDVADELEMDDGGDD